MRVIKIKIVMMIGTIITTKIALMVFVEALVVVVVAGAVAIIVVMWCCDSRDHLQWWAVLLVLPSSRSYFSAVRNFTDQNDPPVHVFVNLRCRFCVIRISVQGKLLTVDFQCFGKRQEAHFLDPVNFWRKCNCPSFYEKDGFFRMNSLF